MNKGLTAAEVHNQRARYGLNKLDVKQSDSLLVMFVRQFHSPFVYVLLAAALVSFGLAHQLNGVFILVVLLLNATIGAIQEYSAQSAAQALKRMVPHSAVVVRDGATQTIDAAELVPDDYVLLAPGDRVPADLQLLDVQDLLIDESILTGESNATAKRAAIALELGKASELPLAEQQDRAFAGTIVTHGRGQGQVVATGNASQIGLISRQVSQEKQVKPPLLQRIERFTVRISYGVLVAIALLFLNTLWRGDDLAAAFLLGVALAVSAIPEGLPAAITVALGIGMRRMAKVNVIIRKLVAVESLGSCTYIASDKTGTLTVNEMTIKRVVLPDGTDFEVEGTGLDVHGSIQSSRAQQTDRDALAKLVRAGMLANEASLRLANLEEHSADALQADPQQWVVNGDGVDLAFLVLAAKHGFDHQQAHARYPELASLPYESENAYCASLNRVDGKAVLSVKGSLEKVLPMCQSASGAGALDIERVQQYMAELADQGFRVLALAGKFYDDEQDAMHASIAGQLTSLVFLGLVAMIDPLRPEAREAIKQCREARIRVGMITGDHPKTALALARQLEICDEQTEAVSGAQLREVEHDPSAFADLVRSTQVFARVEPNQKLQIVQQLIQQGEFVAVTGDGVNDAPALRNAHVGIAMGKRGTDVARESAELLLTDDNFASIVQGICQGRIVYNNIRKVIFLLISTGAAEIMLFMLSILFDYPIPLFPIQLLWLNLVTNGIQDVALAFEPGEGNELRQPPRKPSERIFDRLMLQRIAIHAMVMGGLAFGVFVYFFDQGYSEMDARNVTLLLMVLFENVHVFNSRSERTSIFAQPFFSNPLLLAGMLCAQGIHIAAMYTPGLRDVLQVAPVTFSLWSALLGIALTLIVVGELHKRLSGSDPNR